MDKKIPEFECLECGKLFYSAISAKRAANKGCPSCGGSDIEIYFRESN